MKRKPFLKQNCGFTLVELIVALSISVIVIMFASMIFVQGVKHTRMIAGEAKLVSAATHVTDILALRIRPAISITSTGADQIEILNSDFTTSVFAYTGSELQLDGVSIIQPSVSPTRFSFALIGDTVQVSYELTSKTGTTGNYEVHPLAATTTIAIRN